MPLEELDIQMGAIEVETPQFDSHQATKHRHNVSTNSAEDLVKNVKTELKFHRSKLWPHQIYMENQKYIKSVDLKPHRDEDQLLLDINRSFSFHSVPEGAQKDVLRSRLTAIIRILLRKYPMLHYYQGYHDIGEIIVNVFPHNDDLSKFLERFTLLYLRDYMLPTLDPSIDHLKMIPIVVAKQDLLLGQLLAKVEPFYALSAIITVFSHNVKDIDDVCLIWDLVLAKGSVWVSIYFYSAVLIEFRDSVFEQLQELSGLDSASNVINNIDQCKDYAHSILSNVIEKSPIDYSRMLSKTSSLMDRYPPSSIITRRISRYSVLRTTLSAKQYTDEDLISIYKKQLSELRNKSSKWLTIGTVSVSIAVISLLLRHYKVDQLMLQYLKKLI